MVCACLCFHGLLLFKHGFPFVFFQTGVSGRWCHISIELLCGGGSTLVQHGQKVKISEALFGVVSGALHITRAFVL
jgi:hypothetical protein